MNMLYLYKGFIRLLRMIQFFLVIDYNNMILRIHYIYILIKKVTVNIKYLNLEILLFGVSKFIIQF